MESPDPRRGLCPECGRPPTELPRPAWGAGRRRLAQVLVVLFAVLVYAGMVWRAWPVGIVPFAFGPGVSSHSFPLERFTRDDIVEYTRGAKADGRLLKALALDDLTGSFGLDVAFVQPGGTVTEFQRFGWPTNWLVYRWDGTYDDLYARQSVISQPASRLALWNRLTHISQRTEPDGRRRSRLVILSGIVAPLVILFASWQLGRVLARVIRRAGARTHRAARLIPVLVVLIAAATLTALSIPPGPQTDNIWPIVTPASTPSGLTTGDIARLQHTNDGEAELAATLLAHGANAGPDDVLVIGVCVAELMQQVYGNGGWPRGSVHTSRIEPAGSTPRHPVLRRITARDGWLKIDFTDGVIRNASSSVMISLVAMSVLAGAMILLWLITGWCVRGLARLEVRRGGRRIAAGRCASCRYEVQVGAPAAPASQPEGR